MAKIILACSQKPLAAFIETVLAEFAVDCRVVPDLAGLTAVRDELQPDVILLNSGFPTPADNPALLAELKDAAQIPVISISEPTEVVLADDSLELRPDLPEVLRLPFGKNDLQQKIEKVTGLTLVEKSDRKSGGGEVAVAPVEDLLSPDLPPGESEEKEENMKNAEAKTVNTFELTEIVEEGLPLDELPDRVVSGSSPVAAEELASEVGLVDTASLGEEVSAIVSDDADADFADFGDSLDDLELDLQEPDSAAVTPVETAVENEVTTLTEAEPVSDVTELESADNSPAAVAGDLDALLDDDDFAEVEILEDEDPVLAGLKSAGLTPEVAEVAPLGVASMPVEAEGDESLPEDDLNDFEDLLNGVAEAVREESAADSSVGETAVPEAEPQDGVEAAAEFIEMPRPEEVLSPEATVTVNSAVAADVAAVASDAAPEVELPEDYIEDEEIMAGVSEPDLEIEAQPGLHSPAPSARMAAEPSPAEPRVFTEPQSLDFSQQIEGMTQEWSKQLLQTTYASMDKMIKAIGDLAPTIVNQVAREVIPPLAEKVIKAEIARLEEQLKLEEGEGEDEE